MSIKRLFLSALVCVALALGTAADSTLTWGAPCTDQDGDGYGLNCCLGIDCNDSDPHSHQYALEVCDGLDNNCDGVIDSANGQFTNDAGTACTTAGLGVCAQGTIRCQSGTLQCVPNASPGTEVCNGLDDDCDGIVDDVGGTDADLDGASAGCDCDDSNPLLSAPLQTDAGGQTFCLQLDPIQAFADIPNTPITVRAFHQAGIGSLKLLFEMSSNPVTFNCGGSTSCTFPYTLTQAYEGPRYVRAQLLSQAGTLVKQVDRPFRYGCQGQVCAQDPAMVDYLGWLRGRSYPECISSFYLESAQDPVRLERLKLFLSKRPSSLTQSYTVDFYDIVPTDAHSTSALMGPGQGGNCTPCNSWPDWCPTAMKKDYSFVERHFERTFGINFTFNYHRMDINYQATLPNFRLENGVYTWDSPFQFLSQFAPHSIVHFAMEKLNQTPISNHNIGGIVVDTTFEADYVNGIAGGTGGYTHEWGHTWALPHSFVESILNGPKINGRAQVGLDGIMENGYFMDTRLIDPLEPMERYALEPSNGFTDQATFASAYSTGLIGTYRMPVCGTVDPAFSAVTIISETAQNWAIDVTLVDNGTLPVGYTALEARLGSPTGTLLDQRTIERVAPGVPTVAHYTISKSSAPNGSTIVFILDGAQVISEANAHVPDDSESNNQSSLLLPITVIKRPNVDTVPNQGSPTPSVTDHYLNVDEDPNDGDTTILSFSSGGYEEEFSTDNPLLSTDVVMNVKVRWVAKSGAGTWTACAGLRLGAQEVCQPTRTLAANYVQYEENFPVNPWTQQPWTVQQVNDALIFYRQVSITTQLPKARLTEIVLVVSVQR